MANIIDYITWRGDLSFQASPLNEVDNLIFCEICYLDFTNIVDSSLHQEISLKDAAKLYFSQSRGPLSKALQQDQEKLLQLMAESTRYSSIKLLGFTLNFSTESTMQFAVLTFKLDEDTLFVAYRGTDGSLIGWKEDFEMSVMNIIPSQTEALNYFNQFLIAFPTQKFYLGGHSKGGNLAIYTATYANQQLKQRLIKVFNNDGPGFKADLLNTPEFKEIENKVETYVPQTSIIGMLLDHEEVYTVVKSDDHGIMQHNGFSWEVCQNHFIHLKKIDKASQLIQKTLKYFLAQLPDAEKQDFIDSLFDILSRDDNTTLSGLKRGGIKGIEDTINAYSHLKPNLKQALIKVFKLLFTDSVKEIL